MTIYEQLSSYCDCSIVKEKDVDEAISIVSQLTCWNSDSPKYGKSFCNTFLNGSRREVVDLPNCLPKCPAFYFYPFYYPFSLDSFSFKVAHISGMSEEIFDLTNVNWMESKGAFGIDLSEFLKSCKCSCKCCGCKDEFKLIVEYEAGYDEIPQCILPVMCNLVNVIEAKNNCDCDEQCPSCSNSNTSVNPLTGQVTTSVQTIKYASGDIASVQLETDLARIAVENYKRELSLISLCSSPKELWGSVV